MTGSILDETKHVLGIDPSETVFDIDILMHINSAFATLNQISSVPTGPVFEVADKNATWDGFITQPELNGVKTYIYQKLRLIFDPPPTSFAVNAVNDQIKEFEWRFRELEHVFGTPAT